MRNTVAQVREWLEQEIPLSKIAVITPFFEQDLAVLEQYFRIEGVPLSRATGLRVQSIAAVQSALARLRLSSADLRFSDLEMSFRHGVPDRFEKFDASFREAMDGSDLARSPAVQAQVEPWLTKEREVGLEEFFAIVSQVWPKEGPGSMSAVFNDLFESTPRIWRQTPRAWVAWLEKRIARIEYTNPENLGGLQILPLKSADFPGVTHRIFLGLVEKLPEMSRSLLSAEEISSLGWKYGFFLAHPEQSVLQFEMQWLTSQECEQNIFCYPATDWTGGLTSPQAFWLKGSGQQHTQTTAPKVCRWDEIQSAPSNPEVELRIQRDLGEVSVPLLPAPSMSFSISSIERFAGCPFVFTAEKRFGLKDPVTVDLEFDRMGTGQFYHRLIELLTEPPINWNPEETALTALTEAIREELPDFKIEASLWPAFASRAKTLARRFLAHEQKLQGDFPQHQILERELDFEISYDREARTWKKGFDEAQTKVRGRIDRISGMSEGPVGVYDYKSSTSAKHNFSAWKRESHFQLSFYSWVVNEGLVSEKYKDQVVAACYYNLKKMDCSIGFQSNEGAGKLYRKAKPKDLTREKVTMSWEDLIQDVNSHLERALQGEMAALPRKPEQCQRCEWRNLCRAPHLQV